MPPAVQDKTSNLHHALLRQAPADLRGVAELPLVGAHQDNVDIIHASHVDQYKDLLTGVMTDQPVTIHNSVTATSFTAVGPSSPYAALLQGDNTVPTPAGITNGKVWDFGGATYNIGQFGAKFDGVTDDTVAWQKFIDFITNKTSGGLIPANLGARGECPSGVSIVSSSGAGTPCVNFSYRPGWWLQGAGPGATIVRCATDNAPIFNLGSDTASSMNSYGIDGLQFDYVNSQPSTNTTANPILFSQMPNQGSITNLRFVRGSYAMRIASGIVPPWGTYWNNLVFTSGLTGGAMDWSAAGLSGTPNNQWGRFLIDCANMVGPVFNQIRGYNFTIGTLEFLNNNQNATLMSLASGSQVTIGAIKLETASLTASTTLFSVLGNAHMVLGQFSALGSTFTATGAGVVIKGFVVGASGFLRVDILDLNSTLTLAGGAVAYFLQLPATGTCVIDKIYTTLGTGWLLTDPASTATQETLRILGYDRGWLSQNKGDADYAIALGDPNIASFETTFTAIRNITLPGTTATAGNLPNGLKYKLRFYGAINGANTAQVKCNTVNVGAALATDKVAVEYTYRRSGTTPQTGWIMTAYETLP